MGNRGHQTYTKEKDMNEIIRDGSAVITLERLKELEKAEVECKEFRLNFHAEVKALKYVLSVSQNNYYDYDRTSKIEISRDNTLNVVPVQFFEGFVKESQKVAAKNSEVVCQARDLNQKIKNKYDSINIFQRMYYVFFPGSYEKEFNKNT